MMQILTRKLIELTDVGKINWEIVSRRGSHYTFQTEINDIRIRVWFEREDTTDVHTYYKIQLRRGEREEERRQWWRGEEEDYIRDLYRTVRQWVDNPPGVLEGELLDELIKAAGFQEHILTDYGEKELEE